jgi:butyrate kinase
MKTTNNKKEFHILVLNVGSTSTKVALYSNTEPVIRETFVYRQEDTAPSIPDLKTQLPQREKDLHSFIEDHTIDMGDLDIIVSRGGLCRPGPSGVYDISPAMCDDMLAGRYGTHVSALGPAMALSMARKHNLRAIIIDPPSTDEFDAVARFSGIPHIERKSAFHALNQKAAARNTAGKLGRNYEDINLIVAHLGGGITIGAHKKGRVVDSTHGLSEGPFTPGRAGSLPTSEMIGLISSGEFDSKSLRTLLVGRGGLVGYLGTNRAEDVEARIERGDEEARLVYQAMAYQIAKDIGAMGTVLQGVVDGIVLTGGLAHSDLLTEWIADRVEFLAPLFLFAGEDEMGAMANGALRVLQGKEDSITY